MITVVYIEQPLPIKFNILGCQHQEDALQRKRVAQRTLLVREHTQAFDGGHIRCRLSFVSIICVITVVYTEHPLPIKFNILGCQHQEDTLQRNRVAQRTLLVREHTQAFDGGHLRRQLSFVSIICVITVVYIEYPL